jgi:hypothetical protein
MASLPPSNTISVQLLHQSSSIDSSSTHMIQPCVAYINMNSCYEVLEIAGVFRWTWTQPRLSARKKLRGHASRFMAFSMLLQSLAKSASRSSALSESLPHLSIGAPAARLTRHCQASTIAQGSLAYKYAQLSW